MAEMIRQFGFQRSLRDLLDRAGQQAAISPQSALSVQVWSTSWSATPASIASGGNTSAAFSAASCSEPFSVSVFIR